MNCNSCAATNPADANFCWRCGTRIEFLERDPATAAGDDDPLLRFFLPVGRSGLAITAGYLGLLAPLVVPAPFALLCGILALKQLQANPRLHGAGRAWFGVIMGGLTLTITAIGAVVLAVG